MSDIYIKPGTINVQAIVDTAQPGDMIIIQKGTVDREAIKLPKQVRIREYESTIKMVYRLRDVVMVFDTEGQELTQYRGTYENMGQKILEDAPPEAEFYQNKQGHTFEPVRRDKWFVPPKR